VAATVRRAFGVAIVVAIVGVVHVAAAPPAAACSCVGFTDDEAIRGSEVVFAGELAEVLTPPGVFSSAGPERFVFEVDVVYKGEAKATQSVVTPRDGAGCGLELVGRGPYLVFAGTEPVLDLDAEEGELYSTLCSGTRALDVAPVPAAFGPGDPPSRGSSPIGSPDEALPMPVIVVAGGLVVLIGLTAASIVRQRADARLSS
jgi:hypothetical protein